MARIKTYLGPKIQVTPDECERYESEGCYAAEEKRDGCWAELRTDASGRIKSLTSRVGKRFTGDNVNGLHKLNTGLPNVVLACELECGSEAATERYRALRYRRAHPFDLLAFGGKDVTRQPYTERRRLLASILATLKGDAKKRLPLVRAERSGFAEMFDDVMNDGGEGLVFKRVDSLYVPRTSDGKVEDWIRCKPYRFVDYVVTSVGKSPQGSDNLKCGLYVSGKLKEVCTIKNLPSGTNARKLVGRVVECKGAEVFKSGALRHGHLSRLRSDKDPEDCTLEAARAS